MMVRLGEATERRARGGGCCADTQWLVLGIVPTGVSSGHQGVVVAAAKVWLLPFRIGVLRVHSGMGISHRL
jgi:hypothetical protein